MKITNNFKSKSPKEILEKALQKFGSADFAEIFCEEYEKEPWILKNGKLEKIQKSFRSGYSFRIRIKDQEFLYAFTDFEKIIENAEKIAKEIGLLKKPFRIRERKQQQKTNNLLPQKRISKIIQKMYKKIKKDKEIILSEIGFINRLRNTLHLCTENLIITRTFQNWSVCFVNLIGKNKQNRVEEIFYSDGGINDFKRVKNQAGKIIKKAVESLKIKLRAEKSPQGEMDVVLNGKGFNTGIIIHEAIGHGLEADHKESIFNRKINQKVASKKVTIIDSGVLPKKWGSISFDDEGVKTKTNILVKNGILKTQMHSRETAKRYKTRATGNARRESFLVPPIIRMTNTFLAPGRKKSSEIIKKVKNGIYVISFGGGVVNPTTGNFNFKISEGRKIENGKITIPITGATLLGNGFEMLQKIRAIGNDLSKFSPGFCGKQSQSCPTSNACPTILVKLKVTSK